MTAQRIAGWIAAISGILLLVFVVAGSVLGATGVGQTWSVGSGTTTFGMGPGMMGGFGSTGYGMGPGMMGSGHMGYGYGSQGATTQITGAPTVTVTATDLRFSPTEITLASREANLSLTNDGVVLHDLTVPALGIRIVAAPGQTTTVGLRDLPAGRYAGYCSVPGHAEAGMRIAVVVQ